VTRCGYTSCEWQGSTWQLQRGNQQSPWNHGLFSHSTLFETAS
jgi:hypothetical protein